MNNQEIKILIVDDEELVAQDIQSKLKKLGYSVSGIVDNALDAINHAADKQPDLVIMDIVLPGNLDGIQAAAAIRDEHDIPVIYLTSHTGQVFLDRAKITDPMAYIVKPASTSNLHVAISFAIHKAESERHQHEKEWLDATLVSLADALLVWNPEGKIIRVNHALLKLLQKTEQQLIGLDIAQAITLNNADDGQEITAKLVYLTESQGNFKDDWDLILESNNQQIPVRISGNQILNPLKQCLGYAMLIRDDTERKHQEQIIQESETRFRQLVDHIESIFYLSDVEKRQVIYLSPAYEKIYHYLPPAPLESSDTPFINHVHPDDLDIAKKLINSLHAREKCTAIFRITRPDGEIRWIKTRGYPVNDTQGEVFRMACVIDDVTDNMQKEVKLQQATKVFENTSEGILITDGNSKIISINQAFSKITGYSEQDVLGMTPGILQSGLHPPDFYQNLWNAINTQGYWQGEIINRRKNGETYTQWTSINTIYDTDQNILNYISLFNDITHIKKSQEKLDFLAYHDHLTGFANRLLFDDRLNHAIDRADRDQHQLMVLLLDLDRFKDINDTLGHAAGDSLLKLLADRMRGCLRDEDTLARLGGDEFVFLLEDLNLRGDVHLIADKIQQLFTEPFLLEDREIIVTASIGISIYPSDGIDATTLIKHADIAMYNAKEQGKNCVSFYTKVLNINNINRLTLSTEMRLGLARGQFIVYYQPQINLKNKQIVGAEALVRWQHPTKGFMPPLDFISLAEETGFIEELGKWVLYAACRQCKLWHGMGYDTLVIAVNLSARQFLFTDIAETVKSVLEETGLPAQYLELEITESGWMERIDKVVASLHTLKSLGVSLSIDDFGTGYSSLGYLKRFPIDKLKIDRSFVKDIPNNKQDVAISKSIITLGTSLGLNIIAEGVETEAQQHFFLIEGCHEMQGFLYSKPVPPDEFIPLLI